MVALLLVADGLTTGSDRREHVCLVVRVVRDVEYSVQMQEREVTTKMMRHKAKQWKNWKMKEI